uniref:Uncharacterized protein n=1 Tax=Dictyostelium citrinum TaxID=361072 RepID=B2VQ28_DICCI|nr:hypothetical protein [Dictyostelium citrinum]
MEQLVTYLKNKYEYLTKKYEYLTKKYEYLKKKYKYLNKKWENFIDGLFSWQAWLIALVINFAAFGLLCFLVLIDAIPYLTKLMAQVYDMFITEAEPKMSPEEIYKEAERILEIAKESKKENPGFFKKLFINIKDIIKKIFSH